MKKKTQRTETRSKSKSSKPPRVKAAIRTNDTKKDVAYWANETLKGRKNVAYWKSRFLESEEQKEIWTTRAKILERGQMVRADQAAPDEVQKLHDRIYELEERLQPFDFEFVVDNQLFKVIVRPRTQEVIPVKH